MVTSRKKRLCFTSAVLLVVGGIFSQLNLFSAVAFAESVYVVRGPRGVMTFTTQKPSGGNFKTLTASKYSRTVWTGRSGRSGAWRGKPVQSAYDSLIHSTAMSQSLDPALVKAVVHVESAFKPQARSHKGAMGLMQLMPGTARRFGVKNAYLPSENVEGGVKYLRVLLDRYAGDERLAVAAYNAGEGTVDEYRGIPPYSETQQYVKRVLQMRDLYRCYDDGRTTC